MNMSVYGCNHNYLQRSLLLVGWSSAVYGLKGARVKTPALSSVIADLTA